MESKCDASKYGYWSMETIKKNLRISPFSFGVLVKKAVVLRDDLKF